MTKWLLSLMIALYPFSSVAEAVKEPETYRKADYRSPVPETLSGAVVVSSESAYALWRSGQVAFVDVMPRSPKPKKLPQGTLWREKERRSIPGALWLPNVGYGELAPYEREYFKQGLMAATKGDQDRPLVIFCLEDCWMSWNAAKRAIAMDYNRVFWYPDGTDGWSWFDHPLEVVDPFVANP